MPTMLILRGIPTDDYPRGALEEAPALEYARRMGYTGRVLDVPGNAYNGSPQVLLTLQTIRENFDVAALYGFSGGGYNVRHILRYLTKEEKDRIKLVVVLGAENNPRDLYERTDLDGTPWKLVYHVDPKAGHMAGPRVLLSETPPTPAEPLPKPLGWDLWPNLGRALKSVLSFFRKP